MNFTKECGFKPNWKIPLAQVRVGATSDARPRGQYARHIDAESRRRKLESEAKRDARQAAQA